MSSHQLYRLSAVAGALSAALLLVNVLRRNGTLPTNELTHALGPWASVFGILAVTGFYLWQHHQAGVLGLIGYLLSVAGLAGAVGTEVAVHFIFASLPQGTVDALIAGRTGTAFVVIGALFSLGAALFGTAMLLAGRFPRAAAALYAVGMAVFAWRSVLPEWFVTVDGIVCVAAIGWLTTTLWTASGHREPVAA